MAGHIGWRGWALQSAEGRRDSSWFFHPGSGRQPAARVVQPRAPACGGGTRAARCDHRRLRTAGRDPALQRRHPLARPARRRRRSLAGHRRRRCPARGHSRVQLRHPRRAEERRRLGVATAGRVAPAPQAGGHHGSEHRQLRHGTGAARAATDVPVHRVVRAAQTRGAGVQSRRAVRRRRRADRRDHRELLASQLQALVAGRGDWQAKRRPLELGRRV